MQGDEIREQIEALRQEVRGLSTSILNLRQDDMRKVFGDQFKPVLNERIARHCLKIREAPVNGRIDEGPEQELLDLVDRSVSIFQLDGKKKALKFLDEIEKGIRKASRQGELTSGFEMQILAQIKEYLELSDTIFYQTVPEISRQRPSGMERADMTPSPTEAERLLTPVSNARRVQVMLVLSRESSSLAELCREMHLQKGHLQFHLKALLDVDYICFDRKSRLYSVTSRGYLVLDGVSRLVESLNDKVAK